MNLLDLFVKYPEDPVLKLACADYLEELGDERHRLLRLSGTYLKKLTGELKLYHDTCDVAMDWNEECTADEWIDVILGCSHRPKGAATPAAPPGV